jgi:hypothetical protein
MTLRSTSKWVSLILWILEAISGGTLPLFDLLLVGVVGSGAGPVGAEAAPTVLAAGGLPPILTLQRWLLPDIIHTVSHPISWTL